MKNVLLGDKHMSKYWKVSRNGKKDFEDIYRRYKIGIISSTEGAYHCGISQIGFLKRVRIYEQDKKLKYDTTTKNEKTKAIKLMEKHIDKIKKFNFDFQEQLTDVLYRTCLYIIRNQSEIENEENLIWFSLKRKCKDIKYEKSKNKELKILDKIVY